MVSSAVLSINPSRSTDDVVSRIQISPVTIVQHYASVARCLFQVAAEQEQDKHTQSPKMKSDLQVVMPQHAFNWSLSHIGLVLDLTSAAMTMTFDDLPLSPNSMLPEYQLMQEWFNQVVSERDSNEKEWCRRGRTPWASEMEKGRVNGTGERGGMKGR